MRGNLFPTTVYLSEEQRKQIEILSLKQKKPKAEITREVINEGLKATRSSSSDSAQALLDLAGIIPAGSGLPTDMSIKHNEYTWDE
jgi:hypothetical protein